MGGLAALLSLVFAATSQAAVTQSSITSPASPFFAFDHGQNVTISGSANGGTGSSVKIECYIDDGTTADQIFAVSPGAVPLNADGSFSTSVPVADLRLAGGRSCRLRAVPSGPAAPTKNFSAFAGPRTFVAYMTTSTFGAVTDDFFAVDPQMTAADDYESYGSCGLADSYLLDPSVMGQPDTSGFFCNDAALNPASSNAARPGIEVDGHPAYAPDQADAINEGAPGQPSITIDGTTYDASNGDMTISETEPFVRCPGDPFPADNTNCASFSSSGVEVHRTITQTDDGHIVYIEDSFASADGSSHAVSLLLENDQLFQTIDAGVLGTDVSYEFPGQSAFAPGTAGESVQVPDSAPASIMVQNDSQPDGSTSGARGAITYGQVPSGPFVFSLAAPSADGIFDAQNSFTVPASGSVSIRYAYSTELTSAKATQDALTAEDHFEPPTVSLQSPANGAVVDSSPVTVTGSVSAGSGVAKVTVNGVAATVSGGSFSASVPLSPGANEISAVVTSNGGATGGASESISLAAIKPSVTTGRAKSIKTKSATLTGTVTPGNTHTSYRFEYGRTARYGRTTTAKTVGAATHVTVKITGLKAHTKYHFRLVASDSAGTSAGRDVTLTTAKPTPRRLTARVSPHSDPSAPYVFAVSGALTPPAGVTKRSACKGSVAATVRNGKHKVALKRLRLSSKCRYGGTLRFSATKLPGSGKLTFAVAFPGNKALARRKARPVTVRFG